MTKMSPAEHSCRAILNGTTAPLLTACVDEERYCIFRIVSFPAGAIDVITEPLTIGPFISSAQARQCWLRAPLGESERRAALDYLSELGYIEEQGG